MAKTVADMTDRELLDQALALYHSVYIVDCYSTSDVCVCEMMLEELERRGYEVSDSDDYEVRCGIVISRDGEVVGEAVVRYDEDAMFDEDE